MHSLMFGIKASAKLIKGNVNVNCFGLSLASSDIRRMSVAYFPESYKLIHEKYALYIGYTLKPSLFQPSRHFNSFIREPEKNIPGVSCLG